MVIADSIIELNGSILQEKCQMVQHFDYECLRKRNEKGTTYGPTQPVTMNFTVRVNSPEQAQVYYNEMMSNGHYNFTFLFNVMFGNNRRLTDYDDGMVVDGFIVHLEENYKLKSADQEGTDHQMLLNVRLQVRSITYLGRDKNQKNIFIE